MSKVTGVEINGWQVISAGTDGDPRAPALRDEQGAWRHCGVTAKPARSWSVPRATSPTGPNVHYDPNSRTYDDRKRAEGKRHPQAMSVLAHRRVNVLWALIRDGLFYEVAPSKPTGWFGRSSDRHNQRKASGSRTPPWLGLWPPSPRTRRKS